MLAAREAVPRAQAVVPREMVDSAGSSLLQSCYMSGCRAPSTGWSVLGGIYGVVAQARPEALSFCARKSLRTNRALTNPRPPDNIRSYLHEPRTAILRQVYHHPSHGYNTFESCTLCRRLDAESAIAFPPPATHHISRILSIASSRAIEWCR